MALAPARESVHPDFRRFPVPIGPVIRTDYHVNSSLEGRTCVVVGAGRGIGRLLADHLAAQGADLVLAARTRAAEQVAGELTDDIAPVATSACAGPPPTSPTTVRWRRWPDFASGAGPVERARELRRRCSGPSVASTRSTRPSGASAVTVDLLGTASCCAAFARVIADAGWRVDREPVRWRGRWPQPARADLGVHDGEGRGRRAHRGARPRAGAARCAGERRRARAGQHELHGRSARRAGRKPRAPSSTSARWRSRNSRGATDALRRAGRATCSRRARRTSPAASSSAVWDPVASLASWAPGDAGIVALHVAADRRGPLRRGRARGARS